MAGVSLLKPEHYTRAAAQAKLVEALSIRPAGSLPPRLLSPSPSGVGVMPERGWVRFDFAASLASAATS